MQIFIKTLIGPCFAIPCEDTDTIHVIKEKMEKNYEEGMPPDQMRWVKASGSEVAAKGKLKSWKFLQLLIASCH